MELWKKQLRKIPKDSRDRIFAALLLLRSRDFRAVDRVQLKGYQHIYRIRVGNYRIIYFDDGERMIIKAIPRRDESTYRNF
ncbi:MAG: type II toxin-antitoxin system RelE/ParE family toxin [Candidatus Peregrinibacteria bacterium]